MDPSSSRKHLPAAAICTALTAIFAVVAWRAVLHKSATSDEPNHVVTGWFDLYRADYRLSPDVPPLWEDWIALGMGNNFLRYDSAAAQYRNAPININMGAWCDQVLYHVAGNDGIAAVNRARLMSLAWGTALALLIGWWAWKIAGPVAAVAATFFYCFDPNFLGHAALAKNDVAAALAFAAAAYAVWCVGCRLSILSLAALAILTAVAVTVKFSGLLLAPVLILGFLIRAMMGTPWIIFGRDENRRSRKLVAAVVIWVATFAVTYVGLWAVYDFRFDAGPDGMQLDSSKFVERLRTSQLRQKLGRFPTAAEAAAWKAPLVTRAVLFAETHHLLPGAYTSGFIHTENEDQGRHRSYLLGTEYRGGRWYYFPLAFLFKEPISLLIALALTIGSGILIVWQHRWSAAAIFVPLGVYVLATLTAEVNIGLRHAFPIFPFVFILAGIGATKLWQRPWGRIVTCVLAVALVAETAAAYPDYIAYFNVASQKTLYPPLSDSNLDWGQDLPLLAAWQKTHPDVTLYLDFFGRCNPEAYGIRYVAMPDGYLFDRTPTLPSKPGVVAVSATILMQILDGDPAKLKAMGLSYDRKPDKVLGHTIYLYNYPPGGNENRHG